MIEKIIYAYGFIAFYFDKLLGRNNIIYCSRCKNFFYIDGITNFYDLLLCSSCILKSYRNISNIQYDEEEFEKIKKIIP